MNFAQKLMFIVRGRDDTPDIYGRFVEEQSERLVELVFSNARKAVQKAREAHITPSSRPAEADFIGALIDKLQDAGY